MQPATAVVTTRMMKEFVAQHDLARAAGLASKVLSHDTRNELEFHAPLRARMLWYPTSTTLPNRLQLEALWKFRRKLDDQEALVGAMQAEHDQAILQRCWEIRYPSYADFNGDLNDLDYLLFSKSGAWALLCSPAGFAVFAATSETAVKEMRALLPNWLEDEQNFVTDFNAGTVTLEESPFLFDRVLRPWVTVPESPPAKTPAPIARLKALLRYCSLHAPDDFLPWRSTTSLNMAAELRKALQDAARDLSDEQLVRRIQGSIEAADAEFRRCCAAEGQARLLEAYDSLRK